MNEVQDTMGAEVHGKTAAGFEPIERAFRRNLSEGADVGAAVSVYLHGRPVAQLWGGVAKPERQVPWTQDSLIWLASSTKGLVAAAIMLLVQRGELDLDNPVAHYWPEFGQAGKQDITLRMVMGHRAGVIVFNRPIGYEDQVAHFPIAAELEKISPSWEPGTAHGYHAMTFGFLMSEVCRRVTGLTVGRYFKQELAVPLKLDLHIGLPPELNSRVGDLLYPSAEDFQRGMQDPELLAFNTAMMDEKSLLYRATYASCATRYDDTLNDPSFYAAEEPTGGGIGNAEGLARLYAGIIGALDGVRLFDEQTVATMRTVQAEGIDQVLCMETAYGTGFMLPRGPLWPEFGHRAFGFAGASGALGFADPDTGLAFGFTPNKMTGFMEGSDERVVALTQAAYSCL